MDRSMKLLVSVAVAAVLVMGGVAVAFGASVVPSIVIPKSKQVITYGEASPFVVKAVGGSFDGTVTVYKSLESSVAGFASIASTRTVGGAWGVNPGKLNQNTWFYASYVASGTTEPTSSPAVMIGVMAKLGHVSYKAPKSAGATLTVSGSVEVTPAAASTAHVVLQKLVGKATTVKIKGKKFKMWKWHWEDIAGAAKDAPLTKAAKKDTYTFKTDFGTKVSYKGLTVRAVVTYQDAVHAKATGYGSRLTIRN